MSVDWVEKEGSLETEDIKNKTVARRKRRKIDSCTDLTVEQSPIGLVLKETPSLLDFISKKLLASTKWKASNFPATKLKIGCWERTSKNEGDIVAKFYYAKQKLVWEILENGLKQKLEIQWPDISAIRAHFMKHQPDILEVELRQQPMFFNEVNPQPRKHTNWEACSDFTGGNAATYRRHNLEFPEGTLEKHYEKLLHGDNRLLTLSQRDLASDNSLLFETTDNEMQDTCMINPKFSPTFNQPFSNWYPHHLNDQRSLNASIHTETSKSFDPLVCAHYPVPPLKPTVGVSQMNSLCSTQDMVNHAELSDMRHIEFYQCRTNMRPIPLHPVLNHLEPSILPPPPPLMPVYQSIPNHPIQPHTAVDLSGGLLVHLTSSFPNQCNMYCAEPFRSTTSTVPVPKTMEFNSAMEFIPPMDQATIASNLGTSYLDNFAANSGNSTMEPILNKMFQFYNQDLQNLKRFDDMREHEIHQPPSGAYTTPAPKFEIEDSHCRTNDLLRSIEESLLSETNDVDAFDFYDSSLVSKAKSIWSHLALAILPDSEAQSSNGLDDGSQTIDGTNSALELGDSMQFDSNEQTDDASGLFQMFNPLEFLSLESWDSEQKCNWT